MSCKSQYFNKPVKEGRRKKGGRKILLCDMAAKRKLSYLNLCLGNFFSQSLTKREFSRFLQRELRTGLHWEEKLCQ